MFKKLRTVIYHVNDLAKGREWYISLTDIQPYFDAAFYIGFNINGCELGLDPDTNNMTEGNNSVAYWSVDDIQHAVEKAVTAGAEVTSPITNVGGTLQVAIIKDPFGNHIGLISE